MNQRLVAFTALRQIANRDQNGEAALLIGRIYDPGSSARFGITGIEPSAGALMRALGGQQ